MLYQTALIRLHPQNTLLKLMTGTAIRKRTEKERGKRNAASLSLFPPQSQNAVMPLLSKTRQHSTTSCLFLSVWVFDHVSCLVIFVGILLPDMVLPQVCPRTAWDKLHCSLQPQSYFLLRPLSAEVEFFFEVTFEVFKDSSASASASASPPTVDSSGYHSSLYIGDMSSPAQPCY